MRLAWPTVADAQTYLVQRKADDDSIFTEIGTTTTTDFVDDSLDAGKTGYSYRIVAVNERGSSEPSEPAHADTLLPDKPTELVVGLKGESFVGLIFKPGDGAVTHAIYRSQHGEPATKIGEAKVSTYYDRTAEPGQQYTYAVRAVNAVGQSEPSSEITVRTYAAGLTDQLLAWDRATSYPEGDLVSRAGHTWVAGRDAGRQVPNVERGPWMEAGEFVDGRLGPHRAWTSSWLYRFGDIVSYKDALWQAQKSTQHEVPSQHQSRDGHHGAWRQVG
ncbi:hypothetical protein [Microlunatus elymi]|uniref:hypothetical protein n=1 Tax=Microlunatus elymi TaxID=2596828 RepID=UPI003898F5DC